MIRITVELIKAPLGVEKEVIASALIRNDGTNKTKSYGNYTFELFSRGKVFKRGELKGYSRSKNVWWLVFHCLRLSLWEQGKVGFLERRSPQSLGRVDYC